MNNVLRLSNNIRILPVVHGSGSFSREIRNRILSIKSDCIAVALPPEFQNSVEKGIDLLPQITLSAQPEKDGVFNYVPIDPSQPMITSLRVAKQEGITCRFIDWSTTNYETRNFNLPDTFSLENITYEKFLSILLLTLKRPKIGSLHDQRVKWMAYQLHCLEMDFSNISFICSVLDWPWVKESYDERNKYKVPLSNPENPILHRVDKNTLFFSLSEFPFITYLYEKKRELMMKDKNAPIDGIKEILLRARELFLKKNKIRYHNLTSQTLQMLLQYVRNLTLTESRLLPDLYTLVNSAKQFAGDPFAISVLEAARDYPFDERDTNLSKISLGINQGLLDTDDAKPINMKNRLSETLFEWRKLDLKPDPDPKEKDNWKHQWNPHGQCSWPPEDDKIENLNTHIREQTKHLLSHELARTEKFTSSVKDGIDIRDTLRHWYTGDIYVKEIPPSRGEVEIIVFLFDPEPNPNQYKWRQTWYAEHSEESTLCFFATEYMENLIGPGIGQATYGGCMMLFPPRPILDIWKDQRLRFSQTLEEKLLEAAFFHSREKNITLVSPCLPHLKWKILARRYGKNMIHMPLKRFSNQTIEKVRRFHVLNGKEIRSYAKRFIQEL